MDMKVVVIDDDEQHRNLMERNFKRESWVDAALVLNNEIGVTNKVRAFDPDVVLVDLNMPYISGQDLLDIMMRDDQVPDAAFVVFSGGDATTLRRVQLATGAELALSKSTPMRQIMNHVRSFENRKAEKRKRRKLKCD
jgi:DNA-binding NarL/FixJ family response regulator